MKRIIPILITGALIACSPAPTPISKPTLSNSFPCWINSYHCKFDSRDSVYGTGRAVGSISQGMSPILKNTALTLAQQNLLAQVRSEVQTKSILSKECSNDTTCIEEYSQQIIAKVNGCLRFDDYELKNEYQDPNTGDVYIRIATSREHLLRLIEQSRRWEGVDGCPK